MEEEEDEFGFEHIWVVVSEGHPDIQLEDYKVGLSSGPNHWKQFMWNPVLSGVSLLEEKHIWTRGKGQTKIRDLVSK